MYNPCNDGVDHINIYTRGKTKLGRLLSNLADVPVKMNPEIKSRTAEGLYFYTFFRCSEFLSLTKKPYDFTPLFLMTGFEAREAGKRLIEGVRLNRDELTRFKASYRMVLEEKYKQNSEIQKLMETTSKLPLTHYYHSNGSIVELPQHEWMNKVWEDIRSKYH